MLIGIDASRAFISERTGTENYSYNLIKALAKIDRKNQYRLYIRPGASFMVDGSSGETSKKIPINDKRLTTNSDWPSNFEFKIIRPNRFWTQIGLAWEVLKNPPDVLFIGAHTLPLLRKPGLKTIVTIHDLGYEFLPQYHTFYSKLLLNRSTEYAVKQASKLIAVSNATKADLVSKLKADSDKIAVVHEGVDVEKFSIFNSQFSIKQVLSKYQVKQPYVLFVGTIQPRKNLERLIEAFSKVLRSYGDRVIGSNDQNLTTLKPYNLKTLQLVIVGKLGWMYESILAAPKKFGVEDRLKFLNYVNDEDLPYLYKGAKLFVMPSLAEGFGLPVLEAMAAGVPVVASDIAALREVAAGAALYFNPYDVNQMAEVIKSGLTDDKLRVQLVKAGSQRVKQFSWQKCARETLRVIEGVQRR